MGMQNLWIENRKLPAWIGSILFHTILAWLLMCWFSLAPSHKSAPGVRVAVGSIVLQAQTNVPEHGQSGDSSDDAGLPDKDSDGRAAGAGTVANAPANVYPTIPLLAPGRSVESSVGIESTDGLMRSFGMSGSGGSGGAGTGKEGNSVQFFEGVGTGTKFMYVFDRSASMDGTAFRRAKEELIRSFRSLGEFQQFNIVFYNNEWLLWQPGRKLAFATPAEKDNAERFVWSIPAVGGTRHFEPLKETIEHRPDVIFFLTDGESYDDRTLQLPELSRLNRRWGFEAQINVTQFGSGGLTDSPSKTLQLLAEQNHGYYHYVDVSKLQ